MSSYDWEKNHRMSLYFGGGAGLAITLAFWYFAAALLLVPGLVSVGLIAIAMFQTNRQRLELNDKIHAYRQIE